MTWRTNRSISDREPERYLAERRTDQDPGENEIRNRLATHLIPYEQMVAADYDEFIVRRAKMIEHAMKKLCATEDGHK